MDYAGVVTLEIFYMIGFLALTSAGLAVVFGMMRVINLAHGEFVMIGGYTTIAAAKAGINIYFAMLILSPLVVGIVGLIIERLVIRFLYGRMIDTMLATWGLSLFLVGLVSLHFWQYRCQYSGADSGLHVGQLSDGRLQPVHYRHCDSDDAWHVAGYSLYPPGPDRAWCDAKCRCRFCIGLRPEEGLYVDLHRRCGAYPVWRAAYWRRSRVCCRPRAEPILPRRSSR